MDRFKVGEEVECLPPLKPSAGFSLRGRVELCIPERDGSQYAIGVRLVNGNYKIFSPEQVRRVCGTKTE